MIRASYTAAFTLAAAVLGPGIPNGLQAGSSVEDEPVVFDLEVEDSEVVDVVSLKRGNSVYVASPGFACGSSGTHSFLSVSLHSPERPDDIQEVHTVDLGLGESTSVAAHPSGDYALVATKDPRRPNVNPGRLLAVRGDAIVQSLQVGPGPDSLAISPDGRFAVVACEGDVPDPEECSTEVVEDDVPGSIQVVDLRAGPGKFEVVAVVTAAEMFERYFRGEGLRAARPQGIEPEYVAVAPSSRYALVTLQEQSAVAVVDLSPLAGLGEARLPSLPEGKSSTEAVGARCLAGMVLLPHEHRDERGVVRGVHPDGLAISPDGDFAVTANEAHSKARHLQGISVLDLRRAPGTVKLVATHSIFDLDPTLESSARPERKARVVRGKGKGKATPRPAKLPRLDPEGVVVLRRDRGGPVAAVAIERRARDECCGSVVLLDMENALAGARPVKLSRILVGASDGARPETLDSSQDGRFLFVACERDGGTITLIRLE